MAQEDNPRALGLPHDEWRPGQREAVEWIKTHNGMLFLEAPTGSGKTSIVTALSAERSVTSLVQTKNLQAVNYGGLYGFDVLYGKGNYPCAMIPGMEGNSCIYSDNMRKCPRASNCEYQLQKAIVQGSRKASLNYAYWLSSKWPRQQPPGVLVLDEADVLPDVVIGRAGITITDKHRADWELPPFPALNSKSNDLIAADPLPKAVDWLRLCNEKVTDAWLHITRMPQSPRRARLIQQVEDLRNKVSGTLEALTMSPHDWFIRSGPYARALKNQQEAPGFVCKPLTARHHFRRWFDVAERTVLMSATIGEVSALATELGIEDWTSRVVPNAWPVEMRTILAPKDAPRLGRKATDADYLKQAELVAQMVKTCPPDWFGVALVTRKTEAGAVANRLARLGLQDRVWVPPMAGTDEQTAAWEERKRRAPGSLMITWNHWRGWDGLDERMCFVLKTPYPYLGDPYEQERMYYDGRLYQWRTANTLAQGLGRTRRGRPEDYDHDGQFNGLVAIVDGNWTRVRKSLPEAITDAIVQ